MQNKAALTILLILLSLSSITGFNFNPVSGQIDETEDMAFGVNYLSTHIHYEQYYLPNATLDRDFSLFKQQGLEYVTLVAVWKYLEPQMGQYNEVAIDDLIRVCSYAEKYDLKVIIDFYTMMSNNSWTMPEWLAPRKFEAVFLNQTAKQAWLNYLDYVASRLNSQPNICSWHMMNEPARRAWACDVSIEQYLELWSQMKAVFKSYSSRPVSVRFAAQVFEDPNHFNSDPRILGLMDYLALNWYERHCPKENLTRMVNQASQLTQVMISEFGSDEADDAQQAQQYADYVNLMRNLGLKTCIAWMWRGDYNSPNPQPPGTGYNLAKDTSGTPRPAFYYLDGQPPEINILSPETKTYNSPTIPLTFTVNEYAAALCYSIDQQANVTITGNTTLTGVPDGSHSISVYAKDDAGNWGKNTTAFTVNTVTMLFSDGFERGSFSAWSGTRRTSGETASVTGSIHSEGRYSARFTSNGGRGTEYAYCYRTVASSANLNATGYFYVSKSGAYRSGSGFNLISLSAGSTIVASAGWARTSDGLKWSLTMRTATGTVTAYSTSSPLLNQWCEVELCWKKDAANGFGVLLVNGDQVCQISDRNTAIYGDASQVRFGLVQLSGCYSTTVYVDNCSVTR